MSLASCAVKGLPEGNTDGVADGAAGDKGRQVDGPPGSAPHVEHRLLTKILCFLPQATQHCRVEGIAAGEAEVKEQTIKNAAGESFCRPMAAAEKTLQQGGISLHKMAAAEPGILAGAAGNRARMLMVREEKSRRPKPVPQQPLTPGGTEEQAPTKGGGGFNVG